MTTTRRRLLWSITMTAALFAFGSHSSQALTPADQPTTSNERIYIAVKIDPRTRSAASPSSPVLPTLLKSSAATPSSGAPSPG